MAAKVHMIVEDNGRFVRTVCGRESRGDGIGITILAFAGYRGYFDATEYAAAVSCITCLRKTR